jgi:hypothetical protein
VELMRRREHTSEPHNAMQKCAYSEIDESEIHARGGATHFLVFLNIVYNVHMYTRVPVLPDMTCAGRRNYVFDHAPLPTTYVLIVLLELHDVTEMVRYTKPLLHTIAHKIIQTTT